jgi:hypothetical protein
MPARGQLPEAVATEVVERERRVGEEQDAQVGDLGQRARSASRPGPCACYRPPRSPSCSPTDRRAPSLVVLSACDAAVSADSDFELAGSLASGFLGAGSQHVVATLGQITDSGAPEISTRFYRAGVADPARALAAVQAELAKTGNRDWPYFAVFGPDVCPEGAPGH